MARIVLGYNLPGWTPEQVIGYIYQALAAQGARVEPVSPTSIRVKRGALLLWEGHAEITAYRRGDFIELAISSSELRSFLTGGLIGRSRAAAAREQLQQAVITILAPPPTREGLDSPSTPRGGAPPAQHRPTASQRAYGLHRA